MSTHTPGPWVVRHFPTARGGTMAAWILDALPDQDGKVIANAIATAAGTNEDMDANARLIAAAPDLLAACEAILDKLDYLRDLWGDEGVTRSLCGKVRTAVLNAKTIGGGE
jgi:hypothetical protein